MSRTPLGCSVCIGAEAPQDFWTKDQNGARWVIYAKRNESGTPNNWLAASDQYLPLSPPIVATTLEALYPKIRSFADGKTVSAPTGTIFVFESVPFKKVEGLSETGPLSSSWAMAGIGIVATLLLIGTLKAK